MTNAVGPEWYPPLSHMILALAPFNGVLTVSVTVDPRFPWIWQEQPYHAQLRQLATEGLRVKADEDIRLVHVRCGGRVWLLTDEDDIEVTRGSYIVKLVGDGRYGIELFASQELAAARVVELMNP